MANRDELLSERLTRVSGGLTKVGERLTKAIRIRGD